MPEEPKNPEKKLFIDEDWKSQVEAEREAARHAEQPATEQPAASQPSSGPHVPLPPANLTFLVSSLYIQGAMALGVLVDPATKKPKLELEHAKHSIDLLTMLQEKTEGNRSPDESAELESALHELRLAYVTISEEARTKNSP